MGNSFLTEKQKEENCEYLFKRLQNCIEKKSYSGSIHLSFPHIGIGTLNCKKSTFEKSNGRELFINQKGNTIDYRHLLEYNITPEYVSAVLDDEAFFYFSSC